MKRYVALGAVLTALGAGGAALVQGAAAGGSAAQTKDGGLSVMPALIEHNAQPGQLASMTVANRSTAPLEVTVTPRPWVQAVTGKVSPNSCRCQSSHNWSTVVHLTVMFGGFQAAFPHSMSIVPTTVKTDRYASASRLRLGSRIGTPHGG